MLTTKISHNNKTYEIEGLNEEEHMFNVLQESGTFYEIPFLEKVALLGIEGIYVDAGANIGNHTLFFANHTRCTHVFSIEPHQDVFNVLWRNMKRNKVSHTDVTLLNMAFMDREGFGFIPDPPVINSGVIRPRFVTPLENANCVIKQMDSVIDSVNFIKIDVEGLEVKVLRGASKLIEKCRPVIAAEACHDFHKKLLFDFFNEVGYTVFDKERHNYFARSAA